MNNLQQSDFFEYWRAQNIGKRVARLNPILNLDYALRTAQDNILFAANLSLGKSEYLWSEVVLNSCSIVGGMTVRQLL